MRRNRSRYWATDLTEDKIGAYSTLYKVLVTLSKVSAPFVPFMAEMIYQSLVVSLEPNAAESVHLTSWVTYDKSLINKDLEQEMDLAYKIVRLGRSARSVAAIKNRQPLQQMLVSTSTLPVYYGDIIKEELNIKEIAFGADISKYVNFEIKPNLPVLGKEYGKMIPSIREALGKMNQMELAQTIRSGNVVTINVQGKDIEFNSENLLVTMQGLDGFAFAGEGEIGVVLDTHITEELREEGFVREILSKVQNMRKDSGFEVTDKIKVYVGGNEKLEQIIKKYEEEIKGETLAVEVFYNVDTQYVVNKINGEELNMAVKLS